MEQVLVLVGYKRKNKTTKQGSAWFYDKDTSSKEVYFFRNEKDGNFTIKGDVVNKNNESFQKGYKNYNRPRWHSPRHVFSGGDGQDGPSPFIDPGTGYIILGVQEFVGGMVFVRKTNAAPLQDNIQIWPNPEANDEEVVSSLVRFNCKQHSGAWWGNTDGLLICDTDRMRSSLDFHGVRVMIKFGFMTYLTSVQVDGRARRLGMHRMYKKEDRSVSQYLIIPYHPDLPTCTQEYQKLVCKQTEFFNTLDEIMIRCSLSQQAVQAYGHEDKQATKRDRYMEKMGLKK